MSMNIMPNLDEKPVLIAANLNHNAFYSYYQLLVFYNFNLYNVRKWKLCKKSNGLG